ncbi:MAG: EpsG family protein [Oscillospiraceae bacterium]|nr:EpsG family protein [Oscillospiraceae bacterium]
MMIMTGLALFVVLLGMGSKEIGLQRDNYKPYLVITGIVVTLVMGLRHQYMGADTVGYIYRHEELAAMPSFEPYYNERFADLDFLFSETGFYFFSWLFGRAFPNGHAWIFACSAFVTYSTCRFIHKNSGDAPLALSIYVLLGLFTFNMSGLRQSLAMSICLWAYEHAKRHRLIPFVLTVLLAMQFHKTAVCFFPVYFLPWLKRGTANLLIYFVLLIICLFSVDKLIASYNSFSGEDYALQAEVQGGGLSVILIYLACITLVILRNQSLNIPHVRMAFYGVAAGFTAYITRYFSNQILERISYYYFYFSILLLPSLFKLLPEKDQRWLRIAFSFLALYLFVHRINKSSFGHYRFFFMD